MRRLLFLPLAALLLYPALSQQASNPPEDLEPTIKVDVDLVSVLFSVRDKHGALISNLEKSNLTLAEDGKAQTIRYFNRETNLPLTLGLLVDVSRSQENLIDVERRAASQFFEKVLRNKDMAFLISFGAEAELLQDYTGSPKLLREGLSGLRLSVPVGVGMNPGPVPTMSQPRGTIMYDAVYLAANEKLKGEVGRKAIVIISDGDDQGSRISKKEAIEAAQKADAIIYGFYYVDPYFRGGFGNSGEGNLKQMAEETGGRVFSIGRKTTLEDAFRQLQDELRSQYAIGYTPTNAQKDGTFRRIEIKTDQKELKVQARKGYYAVRPER